jgi:hypothetical protein
MNAYATVLILHSWIRWVVVASAVVGLVRGVQGWRKKREWAPSDRGALLATVISLDTQLLLGLLLYFALSAVTPSSFAALGASMKSSVMRFWAVEHAFGMLSALVAAHVTSVAVRRTGEGRKSRAFAIGMCVTLVLVLATMPWPFLPYGRPLVRLP